MAGHLDRTRAGSAQAGALAAGLALLAAIAAFVVPADKLATKKASPMDRHVGAYYIRLMVQDRPGVIAAVSVLEIVMIVIVMFVLLRMNKGKASRLA